MRQIKDKQRVVATLSQWLTADQIKVNEPMSKHTSFKIGGPADLFLTPKDERSLAQVVAYCHQQDYPFFILGNGSNCLVTDKGYRGIVIQLYRQYNQVIVEGHQLIAQAGILLANLSAKALAESLDGLVFASGIPGTLGGAVYMNAGAYGGEMKDVVEEVTYLTMLGERKVLSMEELAFGYRTSYFQKQQGIISQVKLRLQAGDQVAMRQAMTELAQRRRSKQPWDQPSAGSTFKRPVGHFAGKLIMDSGLSGYQIGDAMVSPKHCGFVVNQGQATFDEVDQLIRFIQETVWQRFGVRLEREVRIVGER